MRAIAIVHGMLSLISLMLPSLHLLFLLASLKRALFHILWPLEARSEESSNQPPVSWLAAWRRSRAARAAGDS